MPELSADFRERLEPIFADLADELGLPPFELGLDVAAPSVRLGGGVVYVPPRLDAHWRRFRTVPIELVRDAAYLAFRKHRPAWDEADREVEAERFMRDHLLSRDAPNASG